MNEVDCISVSAFVAKILIVSGLMRDFFVLNDTRKKCYYYFFKTNQWQFKRVNNGRKNHKQLFPTYVWKNTELPSVLKNTKISVGLPDNINIRCITYSYSVAQYIAMQVYGCHYLPSLHTTDFRWLAKGNAFEYFLSKLIYNEQKVPEAVIFHKKKQYTDFINTAVPGNYLVLEGRTRSKELLLFYYVLTPVTCDTRFQLPVFGPDLNNSILWRNDFELCVWSFKPLSQVDILFGDHLWDDRLILLKQCCKNALQDMYGESIHLNKPRNDALEQYYELALQPENRECNKTELVMETLKRLALDYCKNYLSESDILCLSYKQLMELDEEKRCASFSIFYEYDFELYILRRAELELLVTWQQFEELHGSVFLLIIDSDMLGAAFSSITHKRDHLKDFCNDISNYSKALSVGGLFVEHHPPIQDAYYSSLPSHSTATAGRGKSVCGVDIFHANEKDNEMLFWMYSSIPEALKHEMKSLRSNMYSGVPITKSQAYKVYSKVIKIKGLEHDCIPLIIPYCRRIMIDISLLVTLMIHTKSKCIIGVAKSSIQEPFWSLACSKESNAAITLSSNNYKTTNKTITEIIYSNAIAAYASIKNNRLSERETAAAIYNYHTMSQLGICTNLTLQQKPFGRNDSAVTSINEFIGYSIADSYTLTQVFLFLRLSQEDSECEMSEDYRMKHTHPLVVKTALNMLGENVEFHSMQYNQIKSELTHDLNFMGRAILVHQNRNLNQQFSYSSLIFQDFMWYWKGGCFDNLSKAMDAANNSPTNEFNIVGCIIDCYTEFLAPCKLLNGCGLLKKKLDVRDYRQCFKEECGSIKNKYSGGALKEVCKQTFSALLQEQEIEYRLGNGRRSRDRSLRNVHAFFVQMNIPDRFMNQTKSLSSSTENYVCSYYEHLGGSKWKHISAYPNYEETIINPPNEPTSKRCYDPQQVLNPYLSSETTGFVFIIEVSDLKAKQPQSKRQKIHCKK